MKFKFRVRPIFKDIFLTFITQGIILIAVLFVYRLIGERFGPEGVGKYFLIKKVVGLFQPVILLGFGVGLTHYIAISKNKEQRGAYIKSGGLTVISFALLFLLIINVLRGFFAKTLFGNINHTNLVLPFSFLLAGLILHNLTYSYYRGRLLVKVFNILQLINIGLVPIGILIFFRDITVEKLITLIGVGTIVIASVFSLFYVKELFGATKKWQFKNSLKTLLLYGLPRVPGIFALGGLLSLGPIFASHFTSIKEVGYLSISQSLLITIGTATAPLSLILLPKISNLIANKKQETIRQGLNFLIPAVIQCSIFISVQLILFSDAIIKYWLGPDFLKAVPIMQILFCSIIFYTIFETMRSILNAAKIKPIVAINASISLGVFLFLSGILLFLIKPLSSIISLSIAFTVGTACLGILTYASIRKIFNRSLKNDLRYLLIAIVINILLIIPTILLKSIAASRLYYLIIFEILIGTVYLAILWLLKMGWIKEIPKMILLNNLIV